MTRSTELMRVPKNFKRTVKEITEKHKFENSVHFLKTDGVRMLKIGDFMTDVKKLKLEGIFPSHTDKFKGKKWKKRI